MHIIIVGAGEVGYQIAKFLAAENIDVIVIDKDMEKLKRISEVGVGSYWYGYKLHLPQQ